MGNKKGKSRGNLFKKPADRSVSTGATVNPFDIHHNKVKRNVVGRKLMRCEQGRPDRSRHEAIERRKKTLLQEYLKRDKTGKFIDNRISDEAGGSAARKAKIFDLKMKGVDNALLTHHGQSLSSDNHLTDRPISDEVEDDVDLNLLKRADYVESAHFGGGGDQQFQEPYRKSQSEYLDEMMEEKRKRQYEQEMTWSLTEKLDDEWKNVRSLLTSAPREPSAKSSITSAPASHQNDEDVPALSKDYDVVMREMLFSAKSAKITPKVSTSGEVTARSMSASDEPTSRRTSSPPRLSPAEEKRRQVIERIRQNNVTILPFLDPRIDGLATKRDPLKKLQKKVKREFKGAQRELRKDSAFLKDVWLKEMSERDDCRKKKVKKIIADLASDIHDVRAIKRAS